jgi:very-short-patch-repair endonuclease
VPKNEAGDLLCIHLAELGLEFIREYRFDKERKWRADFFVVEHGILIEIEGAVSPNAKFHPEWQQGRHQRSAGMIEDMHKYNVATMLGYRVLRFPTQEILNGEAKRFLKEWLCK